MSLFISSDYHLGHLGILKHRPFATTEEMDATILDRLNEIVAATDLLYILGDFSWGNGRVIRENRARIKCRTIHFVRGNHDKQVPTSAFSSMRDIGEVKLGARNEHLLVMCHYPMLSWRNSCHNSWMAHGHSHGQGSEDRFALRFDIGVDGHDFRPWSADEIIAAMLKREEDLDRYLEEGFERAAASGVKIFRKEG